MIRSDETYDGKQGLTCASGICTETVVSHAICMHLLELLPGIRAMAHYHKDHETAIHVLEGVAGMRYGDRLQHRIRAVAGDYLYIPAGVPHLPYNPSDTNAVRAVVARADPNEQESVILCPELEDRWEEANV